MYLDNIQVSGSRIYARLFDESEEGPYEVLSGWSKFCVIRKQVPGAPRLYFYRIERLPVCFVHFHPCVFLLVTKFQQIILNMR